MTHAYLIRAHQNPAQLLRLALALRGDGVKVFLHIDRKIDEKPFREAFRAETKSSDVTFIRERTEMNWGGFSMVRATLRCISEIFEESGTDRPDHIFVMTGQDYPIRSNAEIAAFLAANPDREFLSYAKIPTPFWGSEKMGRIDRYNFYDQKALIWPANRDGRIGDRRTLRLILASNLARLVLPRRKPPKGLVPYGGSAWWCLTSQALQHVLDQYRKDPTLDAFFRWTLHAEEIFFQTVLMNSPFADRLVGEYLELKIGDYLWFQKWAGRTRPEILTADDIDEILAADRLFARKFDPDIDTKVLDLLDEARTGRP